MYKTGKRISIERFRRVREWKHMKDVILCDYGKSYLTGCYFINLLDYTTDEEIKDIKTFKTENEMMRYIRENNLINGSDK